MGLFDKLLNSKNSSNESVFSVPTSSLVKANAYANTETETSTIEDVDEDTALKISANCSLLCQ